MSNFQTKNQYDKIVRRAYELENEYDASGKTANVCGDIFDFMYAKAYKEIVGELYDEESLRGYVSHVRGDVTEEYKETIGEFNYISYSDELALGNCVLHATQEDDSVIFSIVAPTGLADLVDSTDSIIRKIKFTNWRLGTYWKGDYCPLINRGAFGNDFVNDLYDPYIGDQEFGEKYKYTFAMLCKNGGINYLPCWCAEVEGCEDPTDGDWDDWMDADDDKYGYTPGWRE